MTTTTTTTTKTFVCNAFSLQMLDLTASHDVHITPIDAPSADTLSNATSAVGHADTANVLGVSCNRMNVSVDKDTTLLVAQIVGGRLPEGATTLPDGFKIVWVKVTFD